MSAVLAPRAGLPNRKVVAPAYVMAPPLAANWMFMAQPAMSAKVIWPGLGRGNC